MPASVRFRLNKIFRIARFICWYFPELFSVYWKAKYAKYLNKKRAKSSERLQCIRAYFGPFWIIDKDFGVSTSLIKGAYYDLTLTVALERLLRRGMSVINVGANIGYFAALEAKRTAMLVLCVEPDPRCIELLQKNKELYPEIQIFPCVATDHIGTEQFILDERATGNSSIASSAIGKPITMQASTLDAIVGKEKVDVMVIDAQGAELKIFAGSPAVLKQLSHIYFEFWPYGLEAAGGRAEDLLSLLQSHGFTLSHFFPSFHPDPELHSLELIASLKTQDKGLGFCNLLASKKTN